MVHRPVDHSILDSPPRRIATPGGLARMLSLYPLQISKPYPCSWVEFIGPLRSDFARNFQGKVGLFPTALQLGIGERIFSQSRRHQARLGRAMAILLVVRPWAKLIRPAYWYKR